MLEREDGFVLFAYSTACSSFFFIRMSLLVHMKVIAGETKMGKAHTQYAHHNYFLRIILTAIFNKYVV
ncbi:hypothetical protein B4119_2257 [Parageobacillus caldoxylosilyticus]|uniref:Uncharacterized protein n=1 Tax=Saccharococcus caldoxylosilyticus TaxID=81408 RepID=A0A150LUY1_9BACL|nr:hypothetical protein B4119_2257 [Parageobacillus caldoxylosilyticus]